MNLANQEHRTNQSSKRAKSSMEVRYITRVGILSAIAFIVMTFEFPVFPAAPYLKMDLSDIIALFGGVALGPTAGIIIEGIKNILNFILHSSTGGIGEVANFLVGIAYIVPISILYRKITSNKGLILGLLLGTISMIVMACIANYFLLIPVYIPGMPAADRMTLILSTYIPFNLIKAAVQSILTVALFNGFKGLIKTIKI